MDSRQARQILMFYRPGDTEKEDPLLAQALELARTDPELAVWFGQHCAAHAILPTKAQKDREHVIPLNKPALAMIMIAALLVGGLVVWHFFAPQPENTFKSYRERMGRLVQRSYPMKNALNDQSKIREYFRTNGASADFPIPHNLERLPGKGSAVFTWHSQPVVLMGMDAGNNTNLFLFVIPREAFEPDSLSAAPKFDRVGTVMTAMWTNGNEVFLLSGPNDINFLQSYLQ